MTHFSLAAMLTLLPICFTRTCVWTGSVCDCTVDCAALCTSPGSCDRPNCSSISSQCCICDTGFFADGLVCSSCGTTACPWMPGSPLCSCSCNASCEKCSGTASTCVVPNCDSSCKTCSAFSVCTLCYPNASLAGTQCVCNAGFFGTNARYCKPCSSLCLTCTSTAEQCTSCRSTAVLTASQTCKCPTGYSIDPTNCTPCDSKCASCLSPDPTQCLSCLPSFKLAGTSPAACVCSNELYFDAAGLACKSCDRTCAACMSAAASSCISCFAGAGLKAAAPSVCICLPPYEKKLDSSKCLNCHRTCQTCLDETSQSCSSCQSNAVLALGAVGPCQCSVGFYPSPDASSCRACSVTCFTCSGPEDYQCLSCKANAGLMDSRCVCSASYYGSPHAGNCVPCPSICNPCIGLQAICVTTIPTPSLSILDNNSLQLGFDIPLRNNLTEADIRVEVRSNAKDLSSVLWSVDTLVPFLTFRVDLKIGSLLPGNIAVVSVYFPNPDSIISLTGMPINVVPLQVQLTNVFNLSIATIQLDTNSQAAQIAHYTSQAALASSLVSSVLTGNFGGLWSLVNQLQMLTYIPMMNIELPVNLAEMLAAINVKDIFSNPFSYLSMPKNDTGCVDLPTFADRYGIDTPVFLDNAGIAFTAVFSCLTAFIPLYIFSKLRLKWVTNYCQRKLPSFKWGVFIRYWLQACMDLGLFALLQVTTMSLCLDYPAYVASIAAAVIVLPLSACGPVVLLVFAIRNKEKFTMHGDPSFNSHWGALFMELKPSPSFAISCFYLLFLMHRSLLALCIVFLQDFPMLQASFICVSQLTVPITQILVHLLRTRPFQDAVDSFSNSLVELGSTLVFLSCSAFALDESSKFAEAAEWVATVALMGSLVISILVSVIRTAILAVRMVLEFRRMLRAGNTAMVLSQIHPLTPAQSKA